MPDQSLNFEITVAGRTQHICGLNGYIVGNQARLDRHCLVRFRAQNRVIEVRSEGASCAANCGAGTTFTGSYELPITGCDTTARARTRAHAQQLDAEQNYRAAYELLAPMLARCSAHLAWLERLEMSNDLALTHYHLSNFAACKNTLAPWQKDSASTDAALAKQWGSLFTVHVTDSQRANYFSFVRGSNRDRIRLGSTVINAPSASSMRICVKAAMTWSSVVFGA